MVNIWLDDTRPEPPDWLRAHWPNEVIDLLIQYGESVDILSLDHDLGNDSRGTGYTVLAWIEEQVHCHPTFIPPREIRIHSANPPAAKRMNEAIKAIYRHCNAHTK